jgi:hypothetical protein
MSRCRHLTSTQLILQQHVFDSTRSISGAAGALRRKPAWQLSNALEAALRVSFCAVVAVMRRMRALAERFWIP